jgi:serine/threonine-protein kinase
MLAAAKFIVETNSVATHERLRRLFDRLVDSPRSEHAAILREANPDEARELQALLTSDKTRSPLDKPLADWLNDLDDHDVADSLIGQHAGPYLLTHVLGRGGSSVVFRATRSLGEFEQTVALKLLQSGLYSQESRRRFRQEQSILMQLSHPNIAPLIDAGLTDAGVPYIAMEEVRGRDLVTYANAEALDRTRRLRLLVEVCRAIDAAHRALIVHRDIKPSNVLVTDDGHVKVLDFGIAKPVSEDTTQTATQHIALTPDYAAPEQFSSGLVTTSADVYALGILAGELLVGARLAPDAELRAADASIKVRWHSLDRDLVNILRKATAPEPERRYVSAGHLADDIDRFLAGDAVTAHPPSRTYRLRKFVARHRLIVTLTAAFVVCIFASLVFALVQAIHARDAAVTARMEAARANTMRDFIFDAFSEAEPTRPHNAPATIPEVVDSAIQRLQSDTAMDAHARLELRIRLAEVVGTQGDLDRSALLLADVRKDANASLDAHDPMTMEVERALERNLYFRGKYAQAREAVDRLFDTLRDPNTESGALLLRDSASIAVKEHDAKRAVRDAQRAVDIAGKLNSDDLLRDALKTLGSSLLGAGDVARAASVYERELALSREEFGADSDQVASALSGLSRAYRRLGEMDKAERYANDSLAIDRKLYKDDHWVTASHLNALGMVLLEKRDLDAASNVFEEGLRIEEKTLGPDHPDVAISLHDVAGVDLAKEDFAAAAPLLARALAMSVSAFGEHHWRTAATHADHGFAAAMLDAHASLDELDAAIADLRPFADRDPHTLGRALEKRARVHLSRGDVAGARSDLAELESVATKATEQSAYWAGRTDCLSSELHWRAGERDAASSAAQKCGAALHDAARADPVLNAEQPLLAALAAGKNTLTADDLERLQRLPHPPRRLSEWTARLAR